MTKKIIIFTILFFFLFFNFIRPKVIIHSPENNSTEVSVVMDVFDKEYNEDVSIWYVNKIKNSTSDYSLLNRVIVNCCGLKKSVFFIRQPSFVHRPQKLYFWRQVQVV